MSKEATNKEGVSTEAPAKDKKKKDHNSTKSVIMGIGLAAVFLSITISAVLLVVGSQYNKVFIGIVSPMVAFAFFLLGAAFSKIFK